MFESLRVFENRVMKRIFGPRRVEVKGEWKKLHTEELNDLYCSPNIFWLIKSRRIRWARHVASMGDIRVAYRIWVGILRERNHLGDTGIGGRIILRWIFRK
jgi:hypothetical protein